MSPSAFLDRSAVPQDAELVRALESSAPLWSLLKSRVAAEHAPLVEEWTHAGKNNGWSLRLKRRSRAVLYMTPCQGHFRAAFALGEKAAAAAHVAGLPDAVLAAVDQAPRYVEGRAVRLEVRSEADVDNVLALARVKMGT